MESDNSVAPQMPNGSTSLKGNHPKGLLHTLTAFRWDLKYILLERGGCPEEVMSNVHRLFAEIDSTIEKLRDHDYDRGV